MIDRAIPYLSLTDTTNEYMLATLNDRRKYFINYLSHAKWIWKSLIWNTVWAIKHKYVEVDCTTSPSSILIPKDMVRFININVVDDCDKIRSLTFDDNMNTLPVPAIEGTCKVCGEKDVLGQCVTDISLVQKEVIIDGNPYIEKLWKKLDSKGDLVEIRIVPVKVFQSATSESEYTIGYETIEKHICKLDVKPCGCVKTTEGNKNLITTHCGCLFNSCQAKICDSTFSRTHAKLGAIKIEDGRIWIQGNNSKQVILSYQTNGECNESELMIPEYAVNAVIFGIDYRSKALAPGYDRYEKKESERAWNRAKTELEEFLNPIIMTEFMNVQMAIPIWGQSPREECFDNQECNDMWTNNKCDVTCPPGPPGPAGPAGGPGATGQSGNNAVMYDEINTAVDISYNVQAGINAFKIRMVASANESVRIGTTNGGEEIMVETLLVAGVPQWATMDIEGPLTIYFVGITSMTNIRIYKLTV